MSKDTRIRKMIEDAYGLKDEDDPGLQTARLLTICLALLERIEAVDDPFRAYPPTGSGKQFVDELVAEPPCQNFATDTMTAEEKRVRTAILDVLDFGHPEAEGNGTWSFYETPEQPAVSEDEANVNRIAFADAVIARVRSLSDEKRCPAIDRETQQRCKFDNGHGNAFHCTPGGRLFNEWVRERTALRSVTEAWTDGAAGSDLPQKKLHEAWPRLARALDTLTRGTA